MIKLSIITVTLNAERFLRDTVESILAQEYAEFEYIVVDGQSSDKTLSIVAEYAARDPRIQYLSEPDHGISDAMNKGIRLASGDVIGFLHADDLFAGSSVFRRVVEFFAGHPEAFWLTGGIRYVDENGNPLKDVTARRFSYRRLLRGNIILHPATFVERNALLQVGDFSTALSYAMDYDLWLRLGRITHPLVIQDILTCFRVHSGSRSCRYVDEAFDEEWSVRRQQLKPQSLSYLFHLGNYLLKKTIHGRFLKRRLSLKGQ